MSVYNLGDLAPQLPRNGEYWIASSASVIGNVLLKRNASVWFGATIRGDNELITIGENSNIQDNSVLHSDEGVALTIGDHVTVGHLVMLHGCTIGDNSLIGMGAVVLNGARIGNNSLVGAGALVTENKVFPDNSLIVGSPAKVIRTLDEAAVERLRVSAAHYVANAKRFKAKLKAV